MSGALKEVLVGNQSMTHFGFFAQYVACGDFHFPPLISGVRRFYCTRCATDTPFATIRILSMRCTKNKMRSGKQVLVALSYAICAISYDFLPMGQRPLKSITVGYMNL